MKCYFSGFDPSFPRGMVYSGERPFPSSQRRGGRDINKMEASFDGADGVVSSAQSSGLKTFRRSDHYYGFALSRSRSAPVCGASVASHLLIDAAATPPLRGGEYSPQTKTADFQTETPASSNLCLRSPQRLARRVWPPAGQTSRSNRILSFTRVVRVLSRLCSVALRWLVLQNLAF